MQTQINRQMNAVILFIIAIPLIEIYLMIKIGGIIGAFNTIFLNSNTFDDLRPIKVVSYLSSFYFLSSITSENLLNKLLVNKAFNNFLSPLAKDVIICS